MNYRVRVLRPALDDLDLQAQYYEEQQEGLGERFLAAARQTIGQIGENPEGSALYGFDFEPLRFVRVRPIPSFRRILVFYHLESGEVQILRVLHGARDIDALADEILPE
jgi:toxin ParE1/3/4